jgi:hypothetical protein
MQFGEVCTQPGTGPAGPSRQPSLHAVVISLSVMGRAAHLPIGGVGAGGSGVDGLVVVLARRPEREGHLRLAKARARRVRVAVAVTGVAHPHLVIRPPPAHSHTHSHSNARPPSRQSSPRPCRPPVARTHMLLVESGERNSSTSWTLSRISVSLPRSYLGTTRKG